MSRIQIALGRMRATSRAVPAANPGFSAEVPFFGGPIGDDELSEFDPKGTLPEDYLEFLRSHRRIIAIDVWNGYAFLSPL